MLAFRFVEGGDSLPIVGVSLDREQLAGFVILYVFNGVVRCGSHTSDIGTKQERTKEGSLR